MRDVSRNSPNLPARPSERAARAARGTPAAVLLAVAAAASFLALSATAIAVTPARAQDETRARGTFLGHAAGVPIARPPYPDVWEPDPLRFPYAADSSLYLPPATPPAPPAPRRRTVTAVPVRFTPPAGVGRDIRVLVQPQVRTTVVQARGGGELQWRDRGGAARRGGTLTGAVRVERRDGRFAVTPVGASPRHGGAAVALRLASLDPAKPLEINGKPYRGTLEFHTDGAGFIVVNVLPLEEYLRGVVPLEMGRHDETRLEALKAQAITARTYAVKRAAARVGQPFDVHASVQDQVYGGAVADHAMSDRAVRETVGLVLLYGDSLAQTYYHSTCGGTTASRHEVWGGEAVPYLHSSPDLDESGTPWCAASRYMQWTQEWDADQLAGIVRRHLPDAGVRQAPAFRRITGFDVRSRFADGRINALDIRTDAGPITLRGDKTRWALKPAPGTGRILESSRFDIEIRGSRITARGNGFGHGIGMCQMGALGRAQAGQGYPEILDAYYPGTLLGKLPVPR